MDGDGHGAHARRRAGPAGDSGIYGIFISFRGNRLTEQWGCRNKRKKVHKYSCRDIHSAGTLNFQTKVQKIY